MSPPAGGAQTHEIRILSLERTVVDQARVLTEYLTAIRELQTGVQDLKQANAVRTNEETHVDERFNAIEKRLDNQAALTRWVIGLLVPVVIAIGGWIINAVMHYGS